MEKVGQNDLSQPGMLLTGRCTTYRLDQRNIRGRQAFSQDTLSNHARGTK
ncbi:hypothetical protein GCM10011408_26650 [Dyella caseinilytica]|nr:hypothetical protein GCM10011408_26650 [Dyella caseinilytica]